MGSGRGTCGGHVCDRGGMGPGAALCRGAAPPPAPPPAHYPAINTLLITGGRGLAACRQLIGWLPSTSTCPPDPEDAGWLIAVPPGTDWTAAAAQDAHCPGAAPPDAGCSLVMAEYPAPQRPDWPPQQARIFHAAWLAGWRPWPPHADWPSAWHAHMLIGHCPNMLMIGWPASTPTS